MNEEKIKRITTFILLSVLIAVYIAWFVFPDNFMHNTSLGLIRYFNFDEFGLVTGTMKLYANPFKSPDWYNSYPQLFYYITLLLSLPLSVFKGLEPPLIFNGLRFGNTLSLFITMLMILLFSRRFFSAFIPGIIAVCLAITTPVVMHAALWSRPDAFEFFLVFCALFFFARFITEESKIDLLFWGIIMAALAFSTKYGGLFLIPLGGCLLFQSVIKGKVDIVTALKISSKVNKIVRSLALFAIPVIIIGSHWGIFLYRRRSTGLSIWESGDSKSINAIFSVALISTALLILYAALVYYLEKKSRIYPGDTIGVIPNRSLRKLYFAVTALNFIALVFAAVYLIFNPYVFTDPINCFRIYGFRLLWPVFSGNLDKSPGLFSGLFWLKNIFDERLMGKAAGTITVALVFCAFIKMFYKRKLDTEQKVFILLLSYPVTLLIFLFFFIRHASTNFLMPVIITLYICLGYAVYSFFKDKRLRYLVFIMMIFISFLKFSTSVMEFKKGSWIFGWKRDPIYKVMDWLNRNVQQGSKVMTDIPRYYVPAQFKKMSWFANVSSEDTKEHIYYPPEIFKDLSWTIGAPGKLRDVNPEIFIRTDSKEFKTINTLNEEFDYLLKNYNLAAIFINDLKWTSSFQSSYVLIYKRKG